MPFLLVANTLKPAQLRPRTAYLQVAYRVSERRACEVLALSRGSHQYRSRADEQAVLRMRLKNLAQARVSYGYRRLHVLLQREGWSVNHQRVYRLYCQESLMLRTKLPRRHVSCQRRLDRPVVTGADESWSMDFMSDELFDGRRVRLLTIVDDFTRESLAIKVAASIGGQDVVEVLHRFDGAAPHAQDHSHGPRARVHIEAPGPVGLPERRGAGLQPAWQAHGQRLHRVIQRTFQAGVSERELVSVLGGR